MIRLFVALELPEPVRARLAGLGGGVPGARWTEPENLHLTVRFIGEVGEDVLAEIDLALAAVRAPGFDLMLDGVGQFGQGRKARVLWAGVERSDALVHLNQKVESALVRAGLAPEERRFSPHVTLARLKDAPPERVARFMEERALFRTEPFPIRHFTLFESRTGNGGPVYVPLREYELD
ncbi:RNA 2',3'-cyclic phosphodiesterase [Arenibaculum pallidiluteum]|uniref:RNA 2',3'-cyclic phosphodiesterase n=1 Tax=Arenibaculum pallidiluteum TaxID=2812559 RepID=UPI001A966BBE|nr:RNA 2',3'-cyclic phosphodiesterase [Arenibaculum pallidiluteum]